MRAPRPGFENHSTAFTHTHTHTMEIVGEEAVLHTTSKLKPTIDLFVLNAGLI